MNSRRDLLILGIISILLIWSVFVQLVGAFYYPNGNWDGEPNVVVIQKNYGIGMIANNEGFSAGVMPSKIRCEFFLP